MSVVKRIAVFGTESTGKTWLAEHLARHFGEPWVQEYAREFWDQNGGVIGLEHMVPIAREQWRREDEAAPKAKRVLICDTDSLTTMLWSDILYGTCPDEVRRGAEKRASGYALYLLLDVDVPFSPDPQRCFPDPDVREKLARVWRGALERRGLPFVEIRGDWATREKAAVAAVENLLARIP
jgi:NadR type nicotinamide-nucleotide adenylyltransferase